MKKVIEELSEIFAAEFEKCGYDKKYAKISLSNRPDLCEYQCNGAMAAAKQYKKAPLIIAEEIVSGLEKEEIFDSIEAVKPGFINLKLSSRYLENYATKMNQDQDLGVEKKQAEKVIIDYGGANVAKPLHVGHLRSAVIGESLKRIRRFMGDDVTGDVHLGDWGLQIGLIITELKHRNPELVYFDENYTGEYPKEAPFTIKDLEEIYPCANAKSKEDAEFKEEARKAILDLQAGNRGYHAIWQHIIDISVSDLKRNYNNLNVSFELWGKESDAQEFIIGTENSIVQHLQFECPDKRFYPLSKDCVCHNMKLTTLMDVYNCVRGQGGEEISLDEEVRVKAKACIDTMLTLGE